MAVGGNQPRGVWGGYRPRLGAACAALLAVVISGVVAASAAPGRPHHTVPPGPDTVPPDREVPADGETEPVGAAGDAADDMAFWIHPADPSLSVVIGTDKEGALETYDLLGQRLQVVDPGSRPGNVDLRGGFSLGGQIADLVGVVGYGMRFYTIDPATRSLTNVTAPTVKPGIPVAGMCMYHSPLSGKFYLFADTLDGRGAQYELVDEGGKVNAILVRGPFQIGGEAEGCVFDDERQVLYVAEEHAGIWAYGAEPDAPTGERSLVDGPENNRLVPDVEGLALVRTSDGGGYLLASSQGDDSFVAYRRHPPHEFVTKFKVVDGPSADGCSRTDGIDALAANLGPAFPQGVFACQDDQNTGPGTVGNQNFKLVRLERIIDLGAATPANAASAGQAE